MKTQKCTICPRECNTDRSKQLGFCLCNNEIVVSKAMLHYWEEPPISAESGSGAVFFSGCTLKCVYCQNKEISRRPTGSVYTPEKLADLFLELQNMGACNINLVTPTHFVLPIIKALDLSKHKLNIPVVYNTSGYEKTETLQMLSGYVDIYLPDFKYCDKSLSQKYSKAPDYFDVAMRAIKEMYKQTGVYIEKDGRAEKGLIIRHLCLPNCRHDSVKILEAIKSALPIENIRLSLMSQFTPDFVDDEYKELKRKITSFEYNYVLNKAIDMGYIGFFQQKNSASSEYTPDF